MQRANMLHSKEYMASSRTERCGWCGVQLLVPPEAQTIQCAVCQEVTRGWPVSSTAQVSGPVSQAANWFKGIVNTVTSGINAVATSGSNAAGPGPSSGGGYVYYPTAATPGWLPLPPPPLPMMPQTASPHGRKRAVLCGVSYYGQRDRLKGSVNDVRCMNYFLVEKLGFPKDSILLLSEEETDRFRIPTKRNIRMAMQWLIQGCRAGDSLVFHFSGHGSRQPDDNGDELDCYDETLCPVDYETQGVIVDDEINDTIVRPLPKGAKLHAIIDACHSGTVLDLPFLCRMNREGYYLWENHRRPLATKDTSGGLALCFSACDDHQTSVDTNALSGTVTTGAMTYTFIQAVQNEPGITYGRLLNTMRSTIRDTKTGLRLDGPVAAFLNSLLTSKIEQEPQLSSSEMFDIYTTPFAL